jgi:hypothetical protein
LLGRPATSDTSASLVEPQSEPLLELGTFSANPI